jgi:hypothetical protein
MLPVQVHEHYRDFAPPRGVRTRVELLLARLAPKHVQGLASVVLTNRAALSRDERRKKTWSRHKKLPLADSAGWYEGAWGSRPASIRLVVDNALGDIPRWAQRLLPMVVTLTLAGVLYHEVGHHIHATVRPEHREREDVAERWGTKLGRGFALRRYWYLTPAIAIVGPPLRWWLRRKLHSRSLAHP